MVPAKRRRIRSWKNRKKVSVCISSNFPWNLIFKFLKDHPRSMILIQMVDKNFSHVVRTDFPLWKGVYLKLIHERYLDCYHLKRVRGADPDPCLRLYKSGLTKLPTHDGNILLAPNLDFTKAEQVVFIRYARRALALKFGHHCAMCGCRYRHELYWSLGMWVCRLCMAENTVSTRGLWTRYGLTLSDIMGQIAGKVFFFHLSSHNSDQRVLYHDVTPPQKKGHGWTEKNDGTYTMFWLPHLSKVINLEACHAKHTEKKQAATLLTAGIKLAFVNITRAKYGNIPNQRRRSCIHHLMLALQANEKQRIINENKTKEAQYGDVCSWAFEGNPTVTGRGGNHHWATHKQTRENFWQQVARNEDVPVLV